MCFTFFRNKVLLLIVIIGFASYFFKFHSFFGIGSRKAVLRLQKVKEVSLNLRSLKCWRYFLLFAACFNIHVIRSIQWSSLLGLQFAYLSLLLFTSVIPTNLPKLVPNGMQQFGWSTPDTNPRQLHDPLTLPNGSKVPSIGQRVIC